jgi:S-adenosylmethionine hydrolase
VNSSRGREAHAERHRGRGDRSRRPYGNLITDIRGADFAQLGWKLGDQIPVQLDGRRREFPYVRTFGDVPEGRPLLYIDSRGRAALALNRRNLSRAWSVLPPATVSIPRKSGR